MRKGYVLSACLCLSLIVTACGTTTHKRDNPKANAQNGRANSENVYEVSDNTATPSASGVLAAIRVRWHTDPVQHYSSEGATHFEIYDHHAIFYDPGSLVGFTLFQTTLRYVTITRHGSRIVMKPAGKVAFASNVDYEHWRAAGAPALAGFNPPVRGATLSLTSYSFVPQGRRLSYREVERLPAAPSALEEVIQAHSNGPATPPSVMLSQYGTLLALAPLTPAVRDGVLGAISNLPGVHECNLHTDLFRGATESVCAEGGGYDIGVIFDKASGEVLSVRRTITEPLSYAPNLPVGTPIEIETFARFRA